MSAPGRFGRIVRCSAPCFQRQRRLCAGRMHFIGDPDRHCRVARKTETCGRLWLKITLVQCAWVASRKSASYLQSKIERLRHVSRQLPPS